MIESLRRVFGKQGDLILVLGMIGILIVLFTPIPAALLDFLLLANISFALLILLLTFYMRKPLDFSTFPSLLLIATLFRLSLNISATRLILSDADAGMVIGAIGKYVVGGNYVIGLIVFLVLIVVQYVVVTNGAQRVAEVAARFTLDSMPGKQMSIDADLNMGLIDEHEAGDRRKVVEKEANFYGAMDGASRFVKGDAIAGIVIILIDIVGGLAIGIAQFSMGWGEALQTYTLLTIGDGIVTQVPALIIATGTGIIVTRAATDAQLSDEITKQITAFPKTLVLIGIGLLLLLFLPGIPLLPTFFLIMIVGTMAYFALGAKRKKEIESEQPDTASSEIDELYSAMVVEPIEVTVGQNLIPLVGDEDSTFMNRIIAYRKQFALDMGFVVPKVRVRDEKKLAPNAYRISIYGTDIADGEILTDRILAINPGNVKSDIEGIATKDPTYGLPAVWIMDDLRKQAREAGYTLVEPPTILMTHLSDVLKQHAHLLLTRMETEAIVNRVKVEQPTLVDELIPNVLSMGETQKVLQNLLHEKVSIRNIGSILEVLVDNGGKTKDTEYLTELVRQRLGPAICQKLTNPEGDLYVLTLDPTIEEKIASGIRTVDDKSSMVLEPQFAEQLVIRLAGQVEQMMNNNAMPVLLCAPTLRRHIRQFTERMMPHLSILSMSEIPNNISIKSYGMVSL